MTPATQQRTFAWPPPPASRRPLAERFEAYHRANPDVYRALVEVCRQVKESGRKKWSINAAHEVVRWRRAVSAQSDEGFRFPNNYRPFYARKIMEQEPDLAGFFETRQSVADEEG